MSLPKQTPQPAGKLATRSSRRQFLATLSAAAGAAAVSTTPAHGFFFFSGSSDLNLDALPREWVAQEGNLIQEYARHLSKLRLENITVHQIIAAHARQKGRLWNTLPPKALWNHMAPTLKVADKLSQAMGVSLKEICSAYRSPSYNARCPGAAPNSFHKQNVALDLIFNTSPRRVARVARELRNGGLFSGGVGLYRDFTHVDTRGTNADW